MYEPPDFTYKELSDTLREYNADDLLFDNTTFTSLTDTDKQLCNDVVNTSFMPSEILNSGTNLLDDNTVNQFFLPVGGTENNKENTPASTDPFDLQTCVLCHHIFTSEADLLDHTISVHVTQEEQSGFTDRDLFSGVPETSGPTQASSQTDWFVCLTCGRVLSTALEIEPTEQLCCIDSNGKYSITRRTLDTMYVCDYCSGLFADSDALDRHKLTCALLETTFFSEATSVTELTTFTPQSQTEYSCNSCLLKFPSTDELKVHTYSCHASRSDRRPYIRKTSSKMWNCGSCNQLFVTARELYRHKRGEDRPHGVPLTAFVCEECDKVLGSICALHTHKKMHKVSKPGYPCRICGRRFNQSGHLAIHMRMHTGERPYPCDLCPKAFKVKVERDDHRRIHTGERPFACVSCPKTFTAAARLREHARIHTDQRPYKCEVCGAAFRRPYARTVHMLIHSGQKPHECDVCKTAFRRSGDMWKHKRTIHGVQSNVDDRVH